MQALGEIVAADSRSPRRSLITLARVSALRRPLALSALEAVPIDTPASRATSRSVADGRERLVGDGASSGAESLI